MKVKIEFESEEERTQVLEALARTGGKTDLPSEQKELLNSEAEERLTTQLAESLRAIYVRGRISTRRAEDGKISPREIIQEAKTLIIAETAVKKE